MLKVVLAAGGTGGHIFPALAVAESLRKKDAQADILFVGGLGPEGEMARKAGLDFASLPVAGVIGRGLKGLSAALGMGVSLVKALGLIGRFAPQVTAGFGGYAAFCPVLASAIRGVPCAIQEQNAVPGRANRFLARFADVIFTGYPDATGTLPAHKTRRTGNPVRASIAAMAKGNPAGDKGGGNLLILGGSQGARAVNETVQAAWASLRAAGVSLWHQTGAADLTRMRAAYGPNDAGKLRVSAFIDDMAGAFEWADLVLARAGASTLAEIALAGKPSVLVPYPYATHDHQRANASYLEKAGAALVIGQDKLTRERLTETVAGLFADRDRLGAMARAAAAEAAPGAADAVAEGLIGLAGGTKRKNR